MNIKFRKRIYYSLLISLIIHLGFVVWSFFVKLLPPPAEVDKTPVRLHFTVSDQKSRGRENEGDHLQSMKKRLQPIDRAAEFQNLEPATFSPDAISQNIESKVPAPRENLNPSSPLDSAHLDERPIAQMVSKKARKATRENLVSAGEISKPDLISGDPNGLSGDQALQDSRAASAQHARLSPVMAHQNGGDKDYQLMKKSASNLRASRYAELGTNLTYELSKYQDPKTNQKYFKLLVKVRDATIDFAVIPKEIIFLVDASQSIGKARLEQFQRGVEYGIRHLNPDDIFNITIFKDRLITWSPQPRKPSPENINDAVKFLKSFYSGSKTDVYTALQSSVNLKEKFNPSYRVFLSDGFPTKGVVDARQVINEISALNNGAVGIFAFGGGVDVSPYMLDFIAYKNNGWSQVVDREYQIGKELSKMYDRIKDPLLLNLRYHLSGVDGSQVFPRSLPDFFKGSEFIIYGTYTTENNFFLQVLGNVVDNVVDKRKEFVVNASLAEAKEGDKGIARQWAFHKVYYLIGQLQYKQNNEALIDQIDDLCAQFKIVTPYSKMFRRASKQKVYTKTNIPQPTSKPAPKIKQNFSLR